MRRLGQNPSIEDPLAMPMSISDGARTQHSAAFALDPRLAADTHRVGDLALSRVLLFDDARFPWLILVPRQSGLRDLIDLPHDDQHRLLDEVNSCAHVLHALDKPDKLNIAALGNVVAQLHVHVIARYTSDAAWPRPVWNVGERVPFEDSVLQRRLGSLRAALRIEEPQ
jgi:diadenosine tetraphosphate (Ap4A) HIT family hydrolase